MGRHQVEIKEGPNSVCERSGKPQVVFRGDQKTFVLKSFHWGSDVCTLRKSLFGGFQCPCHPHNSFASYQEVSLHPCLFPCPRTHAAPGLLPAFTMSSSAASLEQGEAAGGGDPPGRAEECWHIPLYKRLSALGSPPSQLSTKHECISCN